MILSGVNGNVICQGVAMTTLTMQDEKRIVIQRVFRGELTGVREAVILDAFVSRMRNVTRQGSIIVILLCN